MVSRNRVLRRCASFVSFAIALFVAFLIIAVPVAKSEGPDAIMALEGCDANELPIGDASSSEVPLPFSINFAGGMRDKIYVNRNGTVTFGQPHSGALEYALRLMEIPGIAPLRVPVKRTLGDKITWGATTHGVSDAFCVNWINVETYDSGARNSFQLVLVDRSDKAPGNFDIIFNYGKIEWDGTAVEGTARVGYFNGNPIDPAGSSEFTGSGTPNYFLDSSETGLVNSSQESEQLGRYIIHPVSTVVFTISGTVTAAIDGSPLPKARVQVVPAQ